MTRARKDNPDHGAAAWKGRKGVCMNKKLNMSFVAGVCLLVAGIAVLAYGIFMYNESRQSLGGAIGKLFNKRTSDETTAIVTMIAGGAAALLGAFLAFGRNGVRR